MNTLASYPTREQILENLEDPSKELRAVVAEWKHEHYTHKWRASSNEERFTKLTDLAFRIATHHTSPLTDIVMGSVWAYSPLEKTIYMGEVPSIISLLHEVGHHLHGSSEHLACRFSVALFRACFPKEYECLEWQGHMLKRRDQPVCLP